MTDKATPSPSRSRRRAPRKLSWHESWIIRAAAIGSMVILCGYIASITIAIQSIQSVSRIAYNPEIEDLLGQHLESLKEIHGLRQELLIRDLRQVAGSEVNDLTPETATETIRGWLDTAGLETLIAPGRVDIRPLTDLERERLGPADSEPFAWVSRSELRIGDYLVSLPETKSHEEFALAESLKQRYQLIRATWNDQIRPTFIKANVVIMLATFLLLTGTLFLMARQFKSRIETLLKGFTVWSEQNSAYRFGDNLTGELRLIARQFNRMADEVQANRKRSLYLEKIASWQIIARKLAHEIKNPLTPIQMMVSQLVRRYPGEDGAFRSLLEDAQTIITEEVAGLRRMVDNFSQFAQLPEAKLEPRDLVELCRLVVELEKARFPGHDVRFRTDLGEATTPVDDQLLRQVLSNLIKNAGEASAGRHAKIELALTRERNHYHITVTDDGPGIPEDLQSRIFEAYFTTKHTGPTPGMGLGLAICQKVIIDHGGDLAVESRPGATRFTLTIPARDEG